VKQSQWAPVKSMPIQPADYTFASMKLNYAVQSIHVKTDGRAVRMWHHSFATFPWINIESSAAI